MTSSKPTVGIEASSLMPFPGQYLGGIGRTTLELIRAYENMENLPVRIVLFGQRLSRERFQRYGFRFPVRYLPLPRYRAFSYLRSTFPVMEMLTRADLVHVTGNYAPVHRPEHTIVTVHDAMFLTHYEPGLHDLWDTPRILPLARRAAAVITVSEHSKRDLVEAGGVPAERVHVIHWGYDHKRFRPPKDRRGVRRHLEGLLGFEQPYFLGVSCNAGRKNTPMLVRAFLEEARSDGWGHDLVVVWRDAPESLRLEIQRHEQGKRVHFLAGVPDDELSNLYAGATALAFPSRYEGFGLPVLEAMACGTPVITSRCTSLPEVGGDAPYYIDPDSESDLRTALRAFDTASVDIPRMRERGVEQAAKFSWTVCASRTLDVYASVHQRSK